MVSKDPHLISSKLFGLPGLTVSRGGDTFSLCTNTSGPPHSLCKMSDNEVKHKNDIIASGEFGKRDSIGMDDTKNRLGFVFKDIKTTKIIKLKEQDDPELKVLLSPGNTNFVNTIASPLKGSKGLSGGEKFISVILTWCSGEEAAWSRSEHEQILRAKGISDKLETKASKVPCSPPSKTHKPPSFRHLGCPEARTFAQLANENSTSRKPSPDEAEEEMLDSMEKRINSTTTRVTGWEIPISAGLKGGAPSNKVSLIEF